MDVRRTVRQPGEDLFKLPDVTVSVDEEQFKGMLNSGSSIADLLYKPEHLMTSFPPWRHRVKQVSFTRISFAKTIIEAFEFDNCKFVRCLFIYTIFRDCRFRNCEFVNCNFFRSEFSECFVDPAQFDRCLPRKGYENVGVHLFQELLRNSRQQVQPDFADEAQYRFRKWQRYQLGAQILNSGSVRSFMHHAPHYGALFLFDHLSGSGMRVGRLLFTLSMMIILVSTCNYYFATYFGLRQGEAIIGTFGDALYATVVIMTTLGFGDITPANLAGRLAVSCEALFGFIAFAFLTSTLYRKLSS